MSRRSQPVALLRRHYSDFDQFTDEVRAWNLHFKQLDHGPFRGKIDQLVTSEFQIARTRFSRRLHQVGLPPEGLKTFGVPANPNMKLFWRGKHLTGNDVISFPAGGELDAVSDSGFDIFTVSLPTHSLAEAADRIGGMRAQRQLLNEEARRCEATAMQLLRSGLAKFLRSAQETRNRANRAAPQPTQELAHLVANVWLGGNDSGWKEPRRSRARVINAALEHIHHTSPNPLTVADLCKRTGVSERTLENCFQEWFCVSPKRYLQAHRLNGVRRDLRAADLGRAKVIEVAGNWGFWHMGQFAADYREQFGELPSETLKR